MDHLACFVGGMFVLGAPFAADPAEHLKIGKGIGETCYQMYAKMGSGILSLLLLSIFFFWALARRATKCMPKWAQVSFHCCCYQFFFFGHWRDVLPNVCQNGLRYPFIVVVINFFFWALARRATKCMPKWAQVSFHCFFFFAKMGSCAIKCTPQIASGILSLSLCIHI